LFLVASCVAFAAGNVGVASAATTTFDSTGAEQMFTVPAGVTSLNVVAIGAKGGNGAPSDTPSGAGGLGGRATGEIPVTPGQILFIEVGGNGTTPTAGAAGVAGFNGGGAGGASGDATNGHGGGGGGGASDVRNVSATATGTLDSRLVVAGGGAGGGGNSGLAAGTGGGKGGAAGTDGATGTAGTAGVGGKRATGTAGGLGGGNGTAGAAGTGGTGGSGAALVAAGAGGGGGGGLFGGGGGGTGSGGGSSGGGGGGGASGFDPSATNTSTGADTTGVPKVTLTYPDNSFTIGKAKKNKKKGTAKLPVEVSGPGSLDLAGKGLKPVSADATDAGTVKLAVKTKGKTKKKLKKKGKKKVKPSVTFTPTGGDPDTQTTKVKLVRKK
jgi:hypothetical protein